MLIGSCATTGPVKVEVVDTACDWVNPIYLTSQDIRVMDPKTKQDILIHNNSWRSNCAKQTKLPPH
ncbi:hypothetical protein B2M27_09890 [Kluyvera intermedia]|uniref:Lipoprotein n=1 Tax=Kluyvera intermedia TaxID=61648 RepID=A0ABX3UGD3_KLUIN|nr:hypothetical protein [Kluyvera intermedia]ORJ50575.1 hypothetical protein B2M27_09890 [Kluyvera intermedia]